MLIAPSEYDTMTYWAQLAIELEPGSEPFNLLVLAMITAYGTVAGIKLVVRALRTEVNEQG
ncbi:hypothetical protein F3N42_07265 [Marinihelvus fidelis]|uniref:Uncharacterized protein n=2 Tax=Marinihelvus fidelis TaxID=2613842 RepID=A0A5N0TAD7_9GAMM|nr:hypothetical protein F3N42_07265 [Marinihelvus fidelis]